MARLSPWPAAIAMPRPAAPPRRQHTLRAAVLVLALGLLVAACGSTSPAGTESTSGRNAAASPAALVRYPAGQRKAAPAISGKLLTGETLNLADWRGDVVVINIWGSWCAPCRAEAPGLKAVADETKRTGVRFVGFDTRDNRSAALAFERTYGIAYPSFEDPDGVLVLRFNGLVPISAVPSTVVIDRDDRIAARVIGPMSYTTLRDLVKSVAAEKPQPAGETSK